MQALKQAVRKLQLRSQYIGKGIPFVLLVLGLLSFFAMKGLSSDRQIAGSMKWFEIEARKSLCTPSPVNRLVRPMVCLGFETGVKLVAVNAGSLPSKTKYL